MINTFFKLQKAILILSSAILFSQNIKIDGLENRANLNSLNLHLAATKLCKEFYDKSDLVQERQDNSTYVGYDKITRYGCNICAESIRYPFMTPLESFADRYLKDKRIIRNQTNAFTIKSVKEDLKNKYLEEYNKMVDSVDTENMIFYETDLVEGYSMDKKELVIRFGNPHFKNLLPNTDMYDKFIYIPLLKGYAINDKDEYVNMGAGGLGWFNVPMSEARAKEIFDNYASHHHPNPPFSITTKLHYALRLSKEFEGKPRYYQVILKRVEFFVPGVENLNKIQYKVLDEAYKSKNKIAEVVFEEKVYYTEKGFSYQNIKSIK